MCVTNISKFFGRLKSLSYFRLLFRTYNLDESQKEAYLKKMNKKNHKHIDHTRFTRTLNLVITLNNNHNKNLVLKIKENLKSLKKIEINVENRTFFREQKSTTMKRIDAW